MIEPDGESEPSSPQRWLRVSKRNRALSNRQVTPTLLKTMLLAAGVAFLLSPPTHAAGDPEVGAANSAVCASCHGDQGVSPNPMWPNLAGQKDQYLIKQLKAFRDGTRSDPLMSPMAKPLTDEDIHNLAAYYSSLE